MKRFLTQRVTFARWEIILLLIWLLIYGPLRVVLRAHKDTVRPWVYTVTALAVGGLAGVALYMITSRHNRLAQGWELMSNQSSAWPPCRVVDGDQEYDLKNLMGSELAFLEKHLSARTGTRVRGIQGVRAEIGHMTGDAINAITFVARKRSEPGLTIDQVDVDVSGWDMQVLDDCGHPMVYELGPEETDEDGKVVRDEDGDPVRRPVKVPCAVCPAPEEAKPDPTGGATAAAS